MNSKVKHILRASKWPVFLLVIVLGFIWGFVPLAKWLFVGKTLEVYNEVSENYTDDTDKAAYWGVITDTILQKSNVTNGKIDTVVHQQTIHLEHQSSATDGRPKIEDVGTFGDGAGLLNAFFSFLAFMAVLLTIYLQSRKDGHDKQNGARVLFEQEFFAMVGMLENIVSHLRFTDSKLAEDTKLLLEGLSEKVTELLDEIHNNMYETALAHRDSHTYDATEYEEFKNTINEKPGFVRAMWCGDRACEDRIKEETGATSRCMPFDQEKLSDKCICCGKPAKSMVYWGRAY